MKAVILTCLFLLTTSIFAQEKNFFGIEYSGRFGFLLAHRPLMKHLPKDYAYGGEISFYFQTTGASEYSRIYKKPKFGITLIGTSMGNNPILGSEYGIVTFGDFPFIKKSQDEFSGTLGLGLTYLSKTYHPTINPKNTAIGSHLNAFINLGIKYRHYFNRNHYLVMGLNFTHSSNGAIKMPNLGINLVQFNFGFGHQFSQLTFPTSTKELEVDKRWKYTIYGVISGKEEYPIGGKFYPIGNLSFIVSKRFNRMSGLELYADGFYKSSQMAKNHPGMTHTNLFQAGIMAAYNLHISKIRVVIGLGGYVFDKFRLDGIFYHRLGVKYQINKHLVTGLIIKSHWAKADYIEYGIGYTF